MEGKLDQINSSTGSMHHQDDGDHKSGRGGDGDGERHDICRDFMKNVCSRGARCKFYHPPDVEKEQQKDEFNFCIDFQNRGCRREGCRYIHATRDDVERYKRTGEITHSLACAIASVTNKEAINGIPFCKEFKLGKCTRGHRCRYWHVDPDIERERRMMGGTNAPQPPRGAGPPGPPMHQQQGPPQPDPWAQPPRSRGPPQGRNGPIAPSYSHPSPPHQSGYGHGGYGSVGMPPIEPPRKRRYEEDSYQIDLERQNGELRKENDSLKRELARERERYEDLYALFRQHQASQVAAVTAAAAQQQTQQAAVPQQQTNSGMGMGAPISVSMGAGSLPNASYHQSMASANNPTDVAVHWSTVNMR